MKNKKKQATRIQSFLFNKKMVNSKCSQANIIVVVLIILLVLAAIVIVWNVVRESVEKTSGQIGTEALTTQLDIEEVLIEDIAENSKIRIKRGSGKGDITALKFIFYNKAGESVIVEKTSEEIEIPNELETKIYFVNDILDEVIEIEKVSVVPVFEDDKLGMEISEEIPKANLFLPSLISWWKFDEGFGNIAEDYIGGNDGILGGSDNLVNNPGFETGDLNSWVIINPSNLSASVVSNEKKSGTYSVKLTKLQEIDGSGAHHFAIYNFCIDDTNGTSYTMSSWVKGNPGDKAGILIQRSGGIVGDEGWYQGVSNYITLDGTWQFINVSITFDTGNSSDRNGYVRLYLKSDPATLYSAYFDDVRLSSKIPSWTSSGESGSALEFDGVDDYVDIPHSESLDISGDEISVGMWVYYTGSGSDHPLLSKHNEGWIWDPINGFVFGYGFVLDFFWGVAGNNTKANTLPGASKNVWQYLVGTYDRNQLKVYVNGNLSSSLDWTNPIGSTTQDLWIGHAERLNAYFNGSIDNIMIFNRSLTENEINAIYNNQRK